jgi:hypothetical protein
LQQAEFKFLHRQFPAGNRRAALQLFQPGLQFRVRRRFGGTGHAQQ